MRLDGRDCRDVLSELEPLAARGVLAAEVLEGQRATATNRISRLTCWMHLTNSCNLACNYCYIRKSPGKMTYDVGRRTVDRMLESCGRHRVPEMSIKFAGGEPLLRFGLLKQLIRYSREAATKTRSMHSPDERGSRYARDCRVPCRA